MGVDGVIGYIAYMKTGVHIERYEGKDLVISLRHPQELANLVRYFKLPDKLD